MLLTYTQVLLYTKYLVFRVLRALPSVEFFLTSVLSDITEAGIFFYGHILKAVHAFTTSDCVSINNAFHP